MDDAYPLKDRQIALDCVCDFIPVVSSSKFDSNELMYGRAGFLYSLALCRTILGEDLVQENWIEQIVTAIFEDGYRLGSLSVRVQISFSRFSPRVSRNMAPHFYLFFTLI